MSDPARVTLPALLSRYARPFWGWILLLVGLTTAGNVLVVTQPLTLAGILWAILGKQSLSVSGAPAGAFSLNHLGGRVLEWSGLGSANPSTLIVTLAFIYLVQSVIASGLDYAAYLVALRIRVGATALIQSQLYAHLVSLDLRFFHRQRSGELLSRMTQDAVGTAIGIGPLVRGILHHGIQLAAYSVYLMSTNFRLSIAAGVFV